MEMNVGDYLAKKGLTAADFRPKLVYDPEFWLSKKIKEMELELEGNPLREKFSRAFKLLRLASVFDIMKSNIPKEYLASGTALLDFYVQQAAATAPVAHRAALGEALRRLVTLATIYGYTLRALEGDGRWQEVDKQE